MLDEIDENVNIFLLNLLFHQFKSLILNVSTICFDNFLYLLWLL